MATLNIRDLSPDKPIYVKSSTGFGGLQSGDVIIDARYSDGKHEPIIVPKTFIPFCLTELAPYEAILNSSSFRKAVASGLLRIVSEEEAEEELNSPEGREEQERIRQDYFSGITFDPNATNKTISPVEALTKMEEETKINPRIQQIMITPTLNDKEKLAQLRAEVDNLTMLDLDFISGVTKINSPIAKWVQELKDKKG